MTTAQNTEFKPIPDAPAYEINRQGLVRRATAGGNGAWKAGRPVHAARHYHGRKVSMWKDGCQARGTTLARLIQEIFGVPKAQVTNNARGSRIASSKLVEANIPHIRALYRQGTPTEEIGRLFGVSGRTIRDIRAGKIWRHIPLTNVPQCQPSATRRAPESTILVPKENPCFTPSVASRIGLNPPSMTP